MRRREFLAAVISVGLAGCVAVPPPPSKTPTPTPENSPTPAQPLNSLPKFLAFSQAVCEMAGAWLDSDVATQIMLNLEGRPGGSDALKGLLERSEGCQTLADLEQKVLTNEPDRKLADEILQCWYTGIITTEKGPVVVTFMSALSWQCLGYTSAPTSCHEPWWTAPGKKS